MNLGEYSLELLFLSAIKSEKRARDIYSNLSEIVENKSSEKILKTLSKEEQHHERVLRGMFEQLYPEKKIVLPKVTTVPVPDFKITKDIDSSEKIIEIAIEQEEESSRYYQRFAERFDDGSKMKSTLIYLSEMELEHLEKLRTRLELGKDIDKIIEKLA